MFPQIKPAMTELVRGEFYDGDICKIEKLVDITIVVLLSILTLPTRMSSNSCQNTFYY